MRAADAFARKQNVWNDDLGLIDPVRAQDEITGSETRQVLLEEVGGPLFDLKPSGVERPPSAPDQPFFYDLARTNAPVHQPIKEESVTADARARRL